MGFRNSDQVALAWGGVLEVRDGQIKGIVEYGSSLRLQEPIRSGDKYASFNKAFDIATQISELTGVCVIPAPCG